MGKMSRAPGVARDMKGLRGAEDKGYAAGLEPSFTERDCPYKMFEHRHFWLAGFRRARAAEIMKDTRP